MNNSEQGENNYGRNNTMVIWKPEWELKNMNEMTGDQFKEHGKELMERLTKIGDTIDILEKSGWSKSGGLYDLFLYKDIDIEDAKKELINLGFDIEILNLRDNSEDY